MDNAEIVLIGVTLGALAAWLGKAAIMRDYGMNYNGTPRAVKIGTVELKAMRGLDVPKIMQSSNVRAFLKAIRVLETGDGPNAYRMLNGGCLFTGFADHPVSTLTKARELCPLKKGETNRTTAAGAYQFVFASWKEAAMQMGLSDFTPGNQDSAAIGRISSRGALGYVASGDIDSAFDALPKEFDSLRRDGARERLRQEYKKAGGSFDA